MDRTEKICFPKWHQEIDCFKSFKTTFIIEGNIYDLHAYPTEVEEGIRWDLLNLDNYLFNYFNANDYENIVFYNHIDGFTNNFNQQHLDTFLEAVKVNNNQRKEESAREGSQASVSYPATLERATEMIRQAMSNRQTSTVIILNAVSRYISSPDHLSEEERLFYSRLHLSTLRPYQVRRNDKLLNNLLIIVADKSNDVPAWFYLNNPYIKAIHISLPDKHIRRRFIDTQWRFFSNGDNFSDDDIEKYKEKFINLTEGFKNIELNGLKVLSRNENINISRVSDAISLYKYGIRENPWNQINTEKLKNAEAFIKARVKGQQQCVTEVLDILKRAVSGMAGLQHSSNNQKPKGILFFAGPTGTGKTEMAKTLANFLFGDDSACIRFDMSEYQQSHSDQKLLGAPPGYVGYEAGGQLTNAIKEKPFSILLFDEIEKAHPAIFDKFLQILEDGRMTDGKGETVYFSDAIIIFTSNLGIYTTDPNGTRIPNATIDMDYQQIKDNVLKAIKDYFVLQLGRPEILNRIGNNFVVFDYIRPQMAEEILKGQLEKICQALLADKQIQVKISPQVEEYLFEVAANNLENGGRGIGNIVEKYFINPLARYLFDHEIFNDTTLQVIGIQEENSIVKLSCEEEHQNNV